MNRVLQILAFADDVDVIARNKKVLIETYNKLDTEGKKKLGLVVNKEKKIHENGPNEITGNSNVNNK